MSLGAGDFSILWRLCMESPRQSKLASSLPNKRLSYWWLTGCGRNDKRVGGWCHWSMGFLLLAHLWIHLCLLWITERRIYA